MTKEIIRMPDKKLTDEEIIKRLERCVKRGNRNYDTEWKFRGLKGASKLEHTKSLRRD